MLETDLGPAAFDSIYFERTARAPRRVSRRTRTAHRRIRACWLLQGLAGRAKGDYTVLLTRTGALPPFRDARFTLLKQSLRIARANRN
jgi:hypothetical protein